MFMLIDQNWSYGAIQTQGMPGNETPLTYPGDREQKRLGDWH